MYALATEMCFIGFYDEAVSLNYTDLTNEELVQIIAETGSDAAYAQLFQNLRPVILHEAEKYRGAMDMYDRDDFLQEGMILLWTIIQRGHYAKVDKFKVYYGSALRKHLINIYRSYTLKNLVCIDESEDYYGNVTRVLVESEYAKTFREKNRANNRRQYAKKKAAQPPKEPRRLLTPEERREHAIISRKNYYIRHPEKYEEHKARERERMRKKYYAEKAARAATGGQHENQNLSDQLGS